MHNIRFLLALALMFFLAGCTLDKTAEHRGHHVVCEVHGTAMSPEVIRMTSYESVYVMEYEQRIAREFPHHGGWRMQDELDADVAARFHTHVRDYVCPDCDKAFRDYWDAMPRYAIPR